jgi:peptidoglycan hydrolase CwlO-like protein
MAEKEKTLINQIEKLIVDGNKEVLRRLDGLEEGQKRLELKVEGLDTKVGNLDRKVDGIDKKVDRVDRTLNATAHASYSLLTDVQKDVKEVKDALEKHVLLPSFGG